MRYNLTSLELFIATAEERNLTRAAARCHLASSAVSKRISELEEQVGAPLLVRYARGVGLTPAGQAMLHHARQVLQSMQRMENELSEYATGIKGHVRIHAVTSALGQFLPEDLAAFLNHYPLIRLDIEERVGAAIIRAVADGHADIGVFASQTSSQGLQTLPYKTDRLILAVSATHPLAQARSASFKQALDHEFVGPHLDSSLHTLLEGEAKRLARTIAQRTRVSSFDCMCRMVAANLGIAILPEAIALSYKSFLPIKVVALDEEWAARSLLIGIRDFASLSYSARALVDQLQHSG